MGTDAERIIDLYERYADVWVRERQQEIGFYERRWLEQFCALIPPGASVLDIGCGSGEPIAKYLHEHGCLVTGLDSSAAMIAMFQARLPGQPALVSDMRTLSLEQEFQGILAWDSFFHLSHEDQRRMFPIFRAHAAPRAALIFTSGTEHGEAIGRFAGQPLYHASLDSAEYRRLLEDQGFTVVAHLSENPTWGGRTVWLAQLR